MSFELQISDVFSNRTHFRACGQFWLSSIQRARKKKESVNLSPVTSMSSDLTRKYDNYSALRLEDTHSYAFSETKQ